MPRSVALPRTGLPVASRTGNHAALLPPWRRHRLPQHGRQNENSPPPDALGARGGGLFPQIHRAWRQEGTATPAPSLDVAATPVGISRPGQLRPFRLGVLSLFLEGVPDGLVPDKPFLVGFFLTGQNETRLAFRNFWPGTLLTTHKSPLYVAVKMPVASHFWAMRRGHRVCTFRGAL